MFTHTSLTYCPQSLYFNSPIVNCVFWNHARFTSSPFATTNDLTSLLCVPMTAAIAHFNHHDVHLVGKVFPEL